MLSFLLGKRLPRAGHTSAKRLAPRVSLASSLEQRTPATSRYPPAAPRYCPELP